MTEQVSKLTTAKRVRKGKKLVNVFIWEAAILDALIRVLEQPNKRRQHKDMKYQLLRDIVAMALYTGLQVTTFPDTSDPRKKSKKETQP